MDLTAKHGLVLLDQLRKMRETEHLTDVVLVAEGISFPCHRVVLAAFSPYFRVMFTCEDLADHAQRYLRQHFVQVCQNEEVLELEAHQLGKLLSSDDLNVSREESILDVVLRWVQHSTLMDGEVRILHLPELLRKVRLPLINDVYLREVMKRNTALLSDAECLEMINEALEATSMHPSAAPRKLKLRYGMETTDLLLCVGNDSDGIRSRYGSYAERSFCYAPSTSRTFYITSPRYGEALGSRVCRGCN
ncbi:Kelch repeat and BTB domain-containing protein 12 Kelch domain-containing protein 6 [Larimichthys crocea]|uniref:Kelch repeat and BTB domain-containing protein 12 Kelch domain-containing protein 6 n=1 Tax=Larimichthys crocea TaxID=215358 RepID=A0A6G0J4P6_LARCR|nr:Kelch repeat and BTB domain-containing protein 12 Kelch domain-containing protein 6 [Larimichthys crocea]